jgi:hypothetical protein
MRLTLNYDKLLSKFAFKFNLRCYSVGAADAALEALLNVLKPERKVGRCRLTPSNPC